MARSLLPDVKSEFVYLLQQAASLADIQVSYGHPGTQELEAEAIWIGETENWEQDWSNIAAGQGQRKESFDLLVRFVAGTAGQDAMESENRIFDMLEAAQTIVVDQTNFLDLRNSQNGRQLTGLIMSPGELTPMIGNEGRVAVIVATLRASGRI